MYDNKLLTKFNHNCTEMKGFHNREASKSDVCREQFDISVSNI